MSCEQNVKNELLALGFTQIDLQNPDLASYIKFLCSKEALPKWIAQHISRLMTLKDIRDLIKTKFPHLSEGDLENLADMHMNGASLEEIYAAVSAMATPKPK